MEATQQTLPLPYEEIQTGLNRDQVRDILKDTGSKRGRETLFVPIDKIRIRHGFNWRIKPDEVSLDEWLYGPDYLDIQALAAGILASNGAPPMEVDLTADGAFIITDGFRRYHAITRLLGEGVREYPDGSAVNMVEVLVNAKTTTELDRMVSIFTTQENKKLRPLEVAHGLLRIKETYGFSHEKIGDLIGKSRQYVDQKIALATERAEIQQAVLDGKLTPTAATALRGAVKSETDRVHAVQESIDNNIPLTVADAAGKKQRQEKAENNLQMELPLDVSKEKEEAEFALSSAIGKADKIRTAYIGGMNKQNREDVERLLEFMVKDMMLAREFIKKAPDKR